MADDFDRIKGNVQKLVDLQRPQTEIDDYLRQEGLTPDAFRQKILTPKPAPERPRPMSDPIQDIIMRGLSVGLSDDAAALGTATGAAASGAPGSFSDNFKAADQYENKKIEDFKSAHPYVGYPLEIAASLASPLSSVGGKYISGGGSMFSRALRSVPVGAAAGGISGAGYSEGDFLDRLKSSAFGSILGGIAAPVVTAGTEALTNLGGKVIDAGRNFLTAKNNPDLQAQRLLAQALARDGANPAALQAQAAAPGPEGLVDMAGPNTVALGRQATAAPGPARTVAQDFFEGRRVDAPQRVMDELQGLVPQNADKEIARLGTEKLAAAKPLYALSDAADPETLNTPFVKQILNSDVGKQAAKNGMDLWNKDFLSGKVDGPNPFTPVLDAEGNLTLDTAPDMRFLDYMKRGMDQMVDSAYKASSTAGNAMRDVRNAFRDHLKEVNPAYADALASWSGPSHAQDLMDEGIGFISGPGRVVKKLERIASLKGADLEAYRIGAVTGVMDRLGKVTEAGSVYDALANSPDKKKLLAALFPNRADFDKIMTKLLAERAMLNAERGVMGNSVTSRLDAEKADAAGTIGMIRNLADFAQGNVISPALNMMTRMANPARGIDEQTAARLGNMLFTSDPAARQAGLLSLNRGGQNMITQSAAQAAARAARQGLLSGRAGVTTGLLSGVLMGR